MRSPLISLFIAVFILNSLSPAALAQSNGLDLPSSRTASLPAPGTMVYLSPKSNPPVLIGLKVHPDNPFRFDFVMDKGDTEISVPALKEISAKLIKYFLASITTPEKDLWVNLSPYEKDRIVPESFGQTHMGRDLLAQDYMLKQITASLIYPEDKIGKRFWQRIYEESAKKFGNTNLPVTTFNKVWIVPETAVVYENAQNGTAYVVESRLKVMLESDYLALGRTGGSKVGQNQAHDIGKQIVREVVIPALTAEVNEGKNFAQLRQVYNSMILAVWYKKKIKNSILSQVYTDKNKVAGVSIDDRQEKQKIYEQYLQAFKKGAYNYIKDEFDPVSQRTAPRKYFSGGENFSGITDLAQIVDAKTAAPGVLSRVSQMAKGRKPAVVIAASLKIEGAADTGARRFDTAMKVNIKSVVSSLLLGVQIALQGTLPPVVSAQQGSAPQTILEINQKTIKGLGLLPSIIDKQAIREIAAKESYLVQALAVEFASFDQEKIDLFVSSLDLKNNPLRADDIRQKISALKEIMQLFNAQETGRLGIRVQLFKRLFHGRNETARVNPELFLRMLKFFSKEKDADLGFYRQAIEEFPRVFNPHPMPPVDQPALENLIAKYKKIVPVNTYESLSGKSSLKHLRYTLLTILNLIAANVPVSEELLTVTKAKVLTADWYNGTISRKDLEERFGRNAERIFQILKNDSEWEAVTEGEGRLKSLSEQLFATLAKSFFYSEITNIVDFLIEAAVLQEARFNAFNNLKTNELKFGNEFIMRTKINEILASFFHELGHSLHPLGLGKNAFVRELVADIYMYWGVETVLGQSPKKPFKYQGQRIRERIDDQTKRRLFWKRVIYYLETGHDLLKGEHYFSSLQMKNLLEALNGEVDWKLMLQALERVGNDYKENRLEPTLARFLNTTARAIQKDQIENAGLNWLGVTKKLSALGLGFTLENSPSEFLILPTTNLSEQLASFNEDAPKILSTIQEVLNIPMDKFAAALLNEYLQLKEGKGSGGHSYEIYYAGDLAVSMLRKLLPPSEAMVASEIKNAAFALGSEDEPDGISKYAFLTVDGVPRRSLKPGSTRFVFDLGGAIGSVFADQRMTHDELVQKYVELSARRIAVPRVLAAGWTGQGNSYLLIEKIQGKNINEYDALEPVQVDAVESFVKQLVEKNILVTDLMQNMFWDEQNQRVVLIDVEQVYLPGKSRPALDSTLEKYYPQKILFNQIYDLGQKKSDPPRSQAMITDIQGGIDFQADKVNVELQNAGQEIKFNSDPALLGQLQDAAGFSPVITDIQILNDLPLFFGLNPS